MSLTVQTSSFIHAVLTLAKLGTSLPHDMNDLKLEQEQSLLEVPHAWTSDRDRLDRTDRSKRWRSLIALAWILQLSVLVWLATVMTLQLKRSSVDHHLDSSWCKSTQQIGSREGEKLMIAQLLRKTLLRWRLDGPGNEDLILLSMVPKMRYMQLGRSFKQVCPTIRVHRRTT